jgi:hypothetical protein
MAGDKTMISNQPHVVFTVLLHEVPAKLATAAAQRRNISPELLIAQVSSGVFLKGCIDKQLEFLADWRLTKRIREADPNYWKSQKRARDGNGRRRVVDSAEV